MIDERPPSGIGDTLTDFNSSFCGAFTFNYHDSGKRAGMAVATLSISLKLTKRDTTHLRGNRFQFKQQVQLTCPSPCLSGDPSRWAGFNYRKMSPNVLFMFVDKQYRRRCSFYDYECVVSEHKDENKHRGALGLDKMKLTNRFIWEVSGFSISRTSCLRRRRNPLEDIENGLSNKRRATLGKRPLLGVTPHSIDTSLMSNDGIMLMRVLGRERADTSNCMPFTTREGRLSHVSSCDTMHSGGFLGSLCVCGSH